MKNRTKLSLLALAMTAGLVAAPAPPQRLPRLPLRFEPNRGQTIGDGLFTARARGFILSLHAGETSIAFPNGPPVHMRFEGADPKATLAPEQLLDGETNYLLGLRKSAWVSGVPGYGRVRTRGLYPGVDLLFYGSNGALEYDLIVQPGADPSRIRLRFSGAKRLSIDSAGDLLIETPAGILRQHRPIVHQDFDGTRRKVAASYRLDSPNRIRFALAAYDTSRPLIVDPVLTFGTYLGGSGDETSYGALVVDAAGSIYTAGGSVRSSGSSGDFPTTAGAYQRTASSNSDGFITKLSSDGSRLMFSTYIGGSLADAIERIAVHTDGTIYFCGSSASTDFPVTSGVLQSRNAGSFDAVVGQLSADGTRLLLSTYVGGTGQDRCHGMALAFPQRIVIGLTTDSAGLPVSAGAAQGARSGGTDAYFFALNPALTTMVAGTYLGGSSTEEMYHLTLDSAGNTIATGLTSSPNFPTTAGSLVRAGASDGYIAKLDTNLAPVFVQLIGGAASDAGWGVAVDVSNNVYVVGNTTSPNFPTSAGARQTTYSGLTDAFVMKLSPTGTLVYSTYIGGGGAETALAVSADSQGVATVVGETRSNDFPLTPDAFQTSSPLYAQYGYLDAFLLRLNPTGSTLLYSTLLGGEYTDTGRALFVSDAGVATIAGRTYAQDFPTTGRASQESFGTCAAYDDPGCQRLFIARVDLNRNEAPGPRVLLNGIVNAASYTRGGVSPGDIIVLFGSDIGPAALVGLQLNPDRTVSRNLGGTRVLFDGLEVPLIYSSAGQVSAIVPYRVATSPTTAVVVEYQGRRSSPIILPVRKAQMALFTGNSSGVGQAAALNADYSVNTPANAVARGSVIQLFGTGLGNLTPVPGDGTLISAPYPQPTAPIEAYIGERPAKVLYAGAAPGLVAGVFQVNVEIPSNAPTGAAVEVLLFHSRSDTDYSGTQLGVTVAVK